MRQSIDKAIVRLLIVTLVVALGAAVVAADEPPNATRMWIVGWNGEMADVIPSKTTPVEFVLTLSREMSTPGWTVDVDSVKVDGDARRIVVSLTERKPDGVVAQVLTTTQFRIPIGHVPQGTYFVEILSRPGDDGPYQPAHAMVVRAH